jgi:methionyl-tRNA formyltransferase
MNQPSGLRTAFFGTPEFAAFILEELLASGENIVAVVTTPPKHQGRGLKVRVSAVQQVADSHSIPVLAPLKLRDPEFIGTLKTIGADCFCVVAYRILPREVFSMPTKGSFNIHASLLPKYRGAAPINWAIIRGEQETGITTFLLDDKVDTGGILLSERVEIGTDETAGELHDELMKVGATLALKTLQGLGSGTLQTQMQSESEVTTAPKIFPADCIVNFDHTAVQVHNFIRGLSPYPGAVTIKNNSRLKLLRSRNTPEGMHDILPGVFKVTEDGYRLFVGTSTNAIEILELQREGRSVMSAPDFLRGARSLFD